MALAVTALAKPPFLQTFQATYKVKPGTDLAKASCGTCHAGPPKLNPYGMDVKKAMEAAKSEVVTPDILKKVEKLDSDKDGAANIAEIKAGTLPGDPKSKPAKGKKK